MLRTYEDNDFSLLEKWITDAGLLFRFSGPDWNFPLTRAQLDNYISAHPERQFYIGMDAHEKPYAFGEIITGDQHSPRLGRLLVGETQQRGRGLGQVFVKELLAECKNKYDPPQIFLFVFEDNTIAYQCYLKCGFELTGEGFIKENYEGRPVRILKMAWHAEQKEQ